MSPQARFCDHCGTPVAGAAASTPRVPASYTPHHLVQRILADGRALRGERKEVTVLFVDVQGSTELAGAIDAEAFHEIMDGAFQRMLDAVHLWEGTVNQFTGDGVMALFGAPIAHEDHARRALHAALEIQRSFADYAATLRRERGLALYVRLGLNSGSVVVGAIGDDLRLDYTAQGLTTNLAARLQQAADPGSIFVAPATYRLTEGYFRFQPLGPVRVRGVGDPVEVYRLEGEGSVASRLQASLRRGVSPFRGREAELLTLGQCWDRVLAGQGQALCLVGEPGIGKSRLVYEFCRSLGIAAHAEAAALSHTRTAAYFVFRHFLRQLAGIEPEVDLGVARDRLHRRLWDLSPDLLALLPEILPAFGTACETLARSSNEAADERRDRFHDAILAWLRAEAGRRPQLWVIEDLHWLDPSSEDLLIRIAAGARALPLLLMTTSRLPVSGSRLEMGNIREVRLGALAAEDAHALVDAQVEPYPASARLRRVVAERAEGNPFFIEELVRGLREAGDLVLERGLQDLRPGADPVIPPSITALLASRVDRLPSTARDLVADAATLGREVSLAHLRAMTTSERFEDDVALLQRRAFVDQRADGPVATLVFRHVLTQEVVYGALLHSDRQARHRRAAQTLERLYRGRTEEVCDQLGHHWFSSDQPSRAVPYLLAAADAAIGVGAARAAIAHLETAADLMKESTDPALREQRDSVRLKLAGLHFIADER